MTVIAFDGKTMAADRNSYNGHDMFTGLTNKLVRFSPTCIGGYTGSEPICHMLVEWYRNGANKEDFPADAKADNSALLVAHANGDVFIYTKHAWPSIITAPHAAMGCGAVEAFVAMHCGKTAAEAVEVASHFDPYCGGGVDTLSFEQS